MRYIKYSYLGLLLLAAAVFWFLFFYGIYLTAQGS